jgi:protein-S-isoprenylcysteine O-methyltransferase Ste14
MHLSLPLLVFCVVLLSWIAFAIVFIVNKKPSGGPAAKRESKSIIGIALQGVGYATVWIFHRSYFSPIAAMTRPAEVALAIVTILLAIGSVCFCGAAVRALGKQWSLEARVVEGHNLIMHGPYRTVRNPIYTGMLGMLIATGLAVSHWVGMAAGIIIFGIGTLIRIRSEEKLLREMFGSQWNEYARRVPAVLPFLI